MNNPNNPGGSGNPFDPNGNLPRYGETNHPEDQPSFGQQGASSYAGYQAAGNAGGPYQTPEDPSFPTGSFAGRPKGQVDWKEAINYGLKATMANPGLWVLGTFLVYFIPSAVIMLISFTFDPDPGIDSQPPAFVSIVQLVFSVAALVLEPFLLRLCLREVDTGKATWGEWNNDVHLIPTIAVSVISGLVTSAFILILLIPVFITVALAADSAHLEFGFALILLIFTVIFIVLIASVFIQPLYQFMVWYAASGQAGIGSAIKEGFRIGRANYVQLLIFGFVMGLILFFGATLTFGLGLLVVAPASYLAQAHLFRQMAGNVPVNNG